MAKNSKKHRVHNYKISAMVSLSSVLGIVIPLIIVIAFSTVFLSTMAYYFNFSTVTTNSYSMLNQIQWSQTMSSISNELMSNDEQNTKVDDIKNLTSPLKKVGAQVYIECNGSEFFSTKNKGDIINTAKSIVDVNTDKNTNYFGENGIVIVSHINSNSDNYTIIIASTDYTVNNISERYAAQTFSSLVFGKTGFLLLAIALVFIISILVISIITSNAISKPIKKLSIGANEIANGNLDYIIDYEGNNEIGITVSSFNDMTKRLKRSIDEQNQLEQSRKEMIAGVAHDLRTPLTSVKGYVEGLKDGIANTPEKQQRYLDTIYSSTLNMEKLLDELLTVSRLELGKIDLKPEQIDFVDFMQDCTQEIKFDLEKQGFEFEYNTNATGKIIVELDADQFSRVIRNIISNSVKYKSSDRQGKITITLTAYQKSIILSVTDNGIGLDGESLPKIFDTFYRADKARSNVSDGSGIGLAVCRQIVEMHGGKIWATSKENEGLTILISLNRIVGDTNEQKDIDS